MKVMCKMRLQRSRNWESTVAIRREKEREREVGDKKQRQRERQNRNRENVAEFQWPSGFRTTTKPLYALKQLE